MSSSHPNAILGRKRFKADTEGLPCPECGQESLVWLSGECTLGDGTVVPDLEYMHCAECGENLFDLHAMQRIREVRASLRPRSQKQPTANRRKMEKNHA